MTDVTDSQAAMLREFLTTLDPPDIRSSRRLAATALSSGTAPHDFVERVLRPAQVEVGRRWQTNEWTVAQEHSASAITDAVLALMSLRPTGRRATPATIVSGCVEGEWHTLPLRMLGATLASDGHDVTFLGPSLAAAQFARSLEDLDATAVLLSCTYPIALPGARRTIEVAHQSGVSVIIGGRALDVGGVRATALGADAWATNGVDAASILSSWVSERPALARATELCPEGAELETPQSGLVDDCFSELFLRQPKLSEMTAAHLDRTREDIAYILQFCSAALITGDHTVLDEFTLWLRDLLVVRNVPARTIQTSYQSIAAVLGGGFPKTVNMLAAAGALI